VTNFGVKSGVVIVVVLARERGREMRGLLLIFLKLGSE
jgi:hypothetical protein